MNSDNPSSRKSRQVPVFPLPLRLGDPGYTDNHKNLCNRLYDNWYLQNSGALGPKWPTSVLNHGPPVYSLEDWCHDRLSYDYFKKSITPLTSEYENNHRLTTGSLIDLETKDIWDNDDLRANLYRNSPVHSSYPGFMRCDSDSENPDDTRSSTISYFERFQKLDGGIPSCRSTCGLELGLYDSSYCHSHAPCEVCVHLNPKCMSRGTSEDEKSEQYFNRDLPVVRLYPPISSSAAQCGRACKSPLTNTSTISQILAPSTKHNNETLSNTPTSGDRTYRCDNPECQKSFSRKEELTRHRRTHSNERDFECKICKRRFIRKDHMTKHQATHEDVSKRRRYVCPEQGCERRYTRSDALSRHRSSAHPYNNLLPPPPVSMCV